MLRFGILASVVPLILAGLFAHAELLPGPRPCIEAGGSSLQIAETPWTTLTSMAPPILRTQLIPTPQLSATIARSMTPVLTTITCK